MRFSELEGAKVGIWGAGREVGSFAEQLARRLPTARIVAVAPFFRPVAGGVFHGVVSRRIRANPGEG